jgi:N-acetylglucosaminyldiphosphoundecaprenol N-acetyl-beta-D-mannosaminyltransferase
MEESLRRCEGFLSGAGARQVITANPLMILAAEKDSDLRTAFDAADLVVPDGAGLVFAAAVKGKRLSRVPGIELMERLCARAAEKGWRVHFLGAAPGVAEEASRVLSARFPGLTVCGVRHGYFTPAEEAAVVAQVAAAKPDLLFVALATPFQDAWIHRNLGRFGAKLVMGVGGSFDVLSGRLRRAPGWARAVGCEWLFRLVQEPRRAGRMLKLPIFAGKILLGVRRQK